MKKSSIYNGISLVYTGIEIPKNQAALIKFLQSGSNDFQNAYSLSGKKVRSVKPLKFYASWFNRQLKRLQKRNVFLDIPFVYMISTGGFIWQNPGVRGSKANFQALTLQDAHMELKSEINKII